MDFNTLPDWLFDWKTGLFWGVSCFGLAFWLLGYSLHRRFVEVRNQAVRMADGIENLSRQIASLTDMKR